MSNKLTLVRADGSKMFMVRDPDDATKWFASLADGRTLVDLIKEDFEKKLQEPYRGK